MSVILQDIINKHLNREIPIYSIKAENVSGSGTLPAGKHLRLIRSNVENLTVEGNSSVVVLQDSNITGKLTVNDGTIIHIKGGQLQEVEIGKCKIIVEDVTSIQDFTIKNNAVGMLSGNTEVTNFSITNAIVDIGGWIIENWKECNNCIVRYMSSGNGTHITTFEPDAVASELYFSNTNIQDFIGSVDGSIVKFYTSKINTMQGDFADCIIYFKECEIEECEEPNITGSEITSNKTIWKKGIGKTLTMKSKLFLLNETEVTIEEGLDVSEDSFVEFGACVINGSGSLIKSSTNSSILVKGSELHLNSSIVETATDSVLYVADFEQCDCGSGTSFETLTRCRLNIDSIQKLTGTTIVDTATESMIRFIEIDEIELEDALVKNLTDCDLVIHRCGQVKVDTIVNSATKCYIEGHIVENIEGSTFFGSSDYTEVSLKDVTAKGDITLSNTVLNMIFCDVEGDKIELTNNMTMSVLNSKMSGTSVSLENSRLIGTNSRFDHTQVDVKRSTIDFETAEAINLTTLTAENAAVNHTGGTFAVNGNTNLKSSFLRSTSMKLNGSLTLDDSTLIAPGSSINVDNCSVTKSIVQCANMQTSTFNGTRCFLIGTMIADSANCTMVTGQELQGSSGTLTHCLFPKTVFGDSADIFYSIVPYHAGESGQISRSVFGSFIGSGAQMQECVSGHVDMSTGTIINAVISGAGDITSTVMLKSIIAQNSGSMSSSPILKSIVAAPVISGGGVITESTIVAPSMSSGTLSKAWVVAAGSMSGVSATLSVIHAVNGTVSGGGSSVSLCGIPMIPSTPGIINIIGNNLCSADTLNHFAEDAIINFAMVVPAEDCLCCSL